MSELFFIKRIDSLGRVVIPKGIRKDLEIREEDFLKISKFNNAILVEKHNQLLNQKKLYTEYMKLLEIACDVSCVFTNREQLLYSTVTGSEMKALSASFRELISCLKVFKKNGTIKITEDLIIKGYYLVIPIFSSGVMMGSLLVYSENIISERTEKLGIAIVNLFDV